MSCLRDFINNFLAAGPTGAGAATHEPAVSSEEPAETIPKPKKGQVTAANVDRVPGWKKFISRLEAKGLNLNDLNVTPDKIIEILNDDPVAGMNDLNERIEILVEQKRLQLGFEEEKIDAAHEIGPAEKTWSREEVLGTNPKKTSSTGRAVIARMRADGKISGQPPDEIVYHEPTKQWYPIDQCEMGHTHDAVKWWNEEGKFYAPKSAEVRAWMDDAENYELEPMSINRSRGAQIRETYKEPHPDPITREEMAGIPKQR